MAAESARRLMFWWSFCTCVALVFASPTRKFLSNIESSTSGAANGITNDGAAWDDSDDFDLEGGSWLRTASPSALPLEGEYGGEYEDEEGEETRDVPYLPPVDTRLLLEDDDDLSSPLKVRHTGKNPDDSPDDLKDQQFEFIADSEEADKDDLVLDDAGPMDDLLLEDDKGDSGPLDNILEDRKEEKDSSPDDEDLDESDEGDDKMFESPEEDDAQVIYGDHVFLY